MTIAEELLLLAYDKEGRPDVTMTWLDPAIAAAVLAELVVHGRVEMSGRRLRVRDQSRLGEDELDAALTLMGAKSRRPVSCVQLLERHGLRRRLLTRLVTGGVLAETRGKALGFFPVKRWPEARPGGRAEIRARVAAVLGGAEPDSHTGTLIAILHADRYTRTFFPGYDDRRYKEVAEGGWAAEPVIRTVGVIADAALYAMAGE
ncbi:GPP34 family phosphoprotein [Nonomuraea sp. NPDC052634]|uniref:GOLPH3/VPS74 family protein n=1 Tax=Nonomuraea sp. NPDC052634 TaxID=3155813 RepID=UPI0034454BC0